MTDRSTLRDFLLGGLDPKDADALEERMFADNALCVEMEEEREILIEEYVEGSLAGDEAARFERQRSLSPELALEVARLRQLKTLLERRRGERRGSTAETRSFWRLSAAVMAVCFSALAVLLLAQWRENRHLQAELALRVREPRDDAKAVPAQAARSEGIFFLAAGVVRGPQDTARVEIAPGTSFVQLQIEISDREAGAKTWTVEANREGREIFRCAEVVARRAGSISYLPVYIAAESLPEGSYSLRIQSAGHSDESRIFRIEHASAAGTKAAALMK